MSSNLLLKAGPTLSHDYDNYFHASKYPLWQTKAAKSGFIQIAYCCALCLNTGEFTILILPPLTTSMGKLPVHIAESPKEKTWWCWNLSYPIVCTQHSWLGEIARVKAVFFFFAFFLSCFESWSLIPWDLWSFCLKDVLLDTKYLYRHWPREWKCKRNCVLWW